jgi:hypothetical protein
MFDLAKSLLRAARVSTNHHDRRVELRKSDRGLFTDARIRAGDNADFPGHVRHVNRSVFVVAPSGGGLYRANLDKA